jgi:hypothetical protein
LSSVANEGNIDKCKKAAVTEFEEKISDAKPTKGKGRRSSNRKRKMSKKKKEFKDEDSNDAGNSNRQR